MSAFGAQLNPESPFEGKNISLDSRVPPTAMDLRCIRKANGEDASSPVTLIKITAAHHKFMGVCLVCKRISAP